MTKIRPIHCAFIALSSLGISACSEHSEVDPAKTFGADPLLVEPDEELIPNVNIADAVGWSEGGKPTTPLNSMQVNRFATNLQHPRWLYTLPNGDVLTGKTDNDGRFNQWGQKFEAGVYTLRFHSHDYLIATHGKSFYPHIDIAFELESDGGHYHVPLLISPFGFSSYRGS